MQIRGRWALVTGAAKRVGRSIARELATRGMHIVVHYHTSRPEAEDAAAEFQGLGVRAIALRADLARASDVRALAEAAEAESGGVAVLVNSASNYLHVALDDLSEEVWDASLDTNLKGPFLLAWHLGRAMRTRGEGRIVNITDWAGERPYVGYLPYVVSKAGLIGLTKALAKELAPQVTVNAVSPGPVLPPDAMTDAEKEAVARATPLRRLGSPEDVARCVRFLVEEADFTTGSVFLVDGGRLVA